MNLLIRIIVLIAAVLAIWHWPNGLTLLALFLTPLALVLIEQAGELNPSRFQRRH
jgi:hypothetical protein